MNVKLYKSQVTIRITPIPAPSTVFLPTILTGFWFLLPAFLIQGANV